ncbi:MAG: HNH endonuclease [Dehalococcoidia bacterium]
MKRTPPVNVRRYLRQEVGFGCPVPGCGNPFLSWHHFDPPWRVRHHHNRRGMIALCQTHHPQADNGAFTNEQLQEFKKTAKERNIEIKGQFEWMRRRLLVVIGGNFYEDPFVIFEIGGQRILWFDRDEQNYFLLNLQMLTISHEARMRIENNDWTEKGTPEDLETPPSGKKLHAKYKSGDILEVNFIELSEDLAQTRYPTAKLTERGITFPVTGVEIQMRVGGANIEFGPMHITFRSLTMQNNFFRGAGVVLSIGDTLRSLGLRTG